MTYTAAAHFAETWGMVLMTVLFAAAIAYALWPGNRDKFKEAANAPFDEENDDGR
ncbi:MAG TPA: cbb3-type cytochrome c oxidase subunit 3 [Caulobacterales bacterium]|nr:cbb3-type cytochrome c oxidase subunit 3 [Caulobacterales bacterium]